LAPLPAVITQRRNVTVSPLTRTAMLELPLPASSVPTASGAVITKSSTSKLPAPASVSVRAIWFAGPVSCELASASVHAPPSDGQSKPPYRLMPASCTASENAPRQTKMRDFPFAPAAVAPSVIVAHGALGLPQVAASATPPLAGVATKTPYAVSMRHA
jgi:hypothetical protein